MNLVIALLLGLLLSFHPSASRAGTSINTIGSPDGVAINSFDTVAFFTQKKAVPGNPAFSYEWAGAKWLFVSEENLLQFKQNPERWAPQYGGNCALGVSDGYISKKPTNGQFEVMGDKLYLFPPGTNSANGAYNTFWQTGGGPKRRIADGDQQWSKLKARLEAK